MSTPRASSGLWGNGFRMTELAARSGLMETGPGRALWKRVRKNSDSMLYLIDYSGGFQTQHVRILKPTFSDSLSDPISFLSRIPDFLTGSGIEP